MTDPRRAGRRRGRLPPAAHFLTRRIRRLVDLAHDGNVREAADHIGVPYATLRKLYMGRSLNPGVATIKRIASPYEIPDAWFTDERQREAVPLSGWVGLVPFDFDDPEWQPPPGIPPLNFARGVLIPHVAREFAETWSLLLDYLDGLEPDTSRPIVGDATGREFNVRLTTFLLGPLLETAQAGLTHLPADIAYKGDQMFRDFTREELEQWARTLRQLGRFWQTVLGDLLNTAQKAVAAHPRRSFVHPRRRAGAPPSNSQAASPQKKPRKVRSRRK